MEKVCFTCHQSFPKPSYHINKRAWEKRKYCSRYCQEHRPHLKYSDTNQYYREQNQKPRQRYFTSRFSAKRRNLNWTLELEQYLTLISLPCYYCQGTLSITGVGLDRLDNTQGYTLTNVVPCCGICNVWRADHFTPEEVKVAMTAIKKFRQEKTSGLLSN